MTDRFPGSPRVDTLVGIRIEVTETPDKAIAYYDKLLEVDATHIVRGFAVVAPITSKPH